MTIQFRTANSSVGWTESMMLAAQQHCEMDERREQEKRDRELLKINRVDLKFV